MKIVLWIPLVLLPAAGICFGQCNQYPLRPSLLPPCPTIASQVSKAIDASRDFQKASAELTSAVEGARRAYWKVFPDGSGVKEAESIFLLKLAEKDFNYLTFALPLGMNDPTVQVANLMTLDFDNLKNFPRNVDGGIRPLAFRLFGEWVNALRRSQGRVQDGAFTNAPAILATYATDQSNWRKAYEDARNWAEFLASGLDIQKYLTPQVYIVNQMETGVSESLAKGKPKDLPDPRGASMDLYNLFVKNFGEKEVLAAAAKTLAAPKNSVGGLAQRAEVLIGTYQSQPSPNPYMLFLTQLTNATPHNYALALCLDQYGLMGSQVVNTLSSKEQWDKAAATYGQLLARFGEPAIVAAAGRIKDLPKDGAGGIRGDPQAKGAIYWFTTLLQDPKTPLPDSGQFLVSSYDPRWNGKTVDVRGTVSRVEIDKGKFPPYATIHFKESKNDKFTAYTPNSEILDEILPKGVTTLAGAVVEVYGNVTDWKDGAGVRFQIRNNLKLLDANALTNFKESSPEWMTLSPAPSAVAAAPVTENQAEVARVEGAREATIRRGSVQSAPPTPSQGATPIIGARTRPSSNPRDAASIAPPRVPAAPAPAAAPVRDPLVNNVISLLKAKFPEIRIMLMLKQRNRPLNLTGADRGELEAAGASEKLIEAMMNPALIGPDVTPQAAAAAARQNAAAPR